MTDTKIDGKRLRQVAGAFATGVTVIAIEKTDGSIHGMTASSFVSVSLDPPLVSFCVQLEGSICPLLKVGETVGISILEATQKDISNQFAGINKEEIEVPLTKTTTGGVIVNKALAWYSTTIHQILPAGDHLLVLCEVKDLDRAEDGQPLIYWSGYRTTGEQV